MNDSMESVKAKLRAEFLSALDVIEIEHKVSVKEVIAMSGGKIDYVTDAPLSIKSARLSRKIDKPTGAVFYALKVVVD